MNLRDKSDSLKRWVERTWSGDDNNRQHTNEVGDIDFFVFISFLFFFLFFYVFSGRGRLARPLNPPPVYTRCIQRTSYRFVSDIRPSVEIQYFNNPDNHASPSQYTNDTKFRRSRTSRTRCCCAYTVPSRASVLFRLICARGVFTRSRAFRSLPCSVLLYIYNAFELLSVHSLKQKLHGKNN